MSLAKKVKGQKPAPDRDLSSSEEIKRAFLDGLISKAGVLSRVAELFDPAGWYEPIKVQMKMSFQELTPFDWADKVPDDQADAWVSHFSFMQSVRTLSIPHYAFPLAADPNSRLHGPVSVPVAATRPGHPQCSLSPLLPLEGCLQS
jgi:hypothetical protein